MRSDERKRLILPAWKLVLMHAPFRVYRHAGAGFAPGVRNAVFYGARVLKSILFDRDRVKYLVIRFLRIFK